jgi:hypothetical protein
MMAMSWRCRWMSMGLIFNVVLLHFSRAEPPAFGSPALSVTTSWIGNTLPGNPLWIQQDIAGLTVTADGTVFTNVPWEEGGGNVGEYKEGTLRRYAKHTHGWGLNGGLAVAVNAKFLYITAVCTNEGGGLQDEATWPPKGRRWFGVSRRLRADITQAASFPGGKGGKGDTLKECFLPVNDVEETKGQASPEAGNLVGLAANDSSLFISNPLTQSIHVLDAETMQKKAEWPCEHPGALQIDEKGRLWVLAGVPEAQRFLRFDAEGHSTSLALPPLLKFPGAFCLNGTTHVLVTDERQSVIRSLQIQGADESEFKSDGVIGALGGQAGTFIGRVVRPGTPAPPATFLTGGVVGDLRFNKLTAIGLDAEKNLYVAHGGGSQGGSTVLESYDAAGKNRWRVHGLTFIDVPDVDPYDDTRLFTKEEFFTMDWTQPPGKEWKYTASTLHAHSLKEDPRLHVNASGTWVRRLKGRTILFINDMSGERLQVYRFEGNRMGHHALPAAMICPSPIKPRPGAPESAPWPPHQPAEGAWIWRDLDADSHFAANEFFPAPEGKALPKSWGWWVDLDGGVWLASERDGIRHWPYGGVDDNGCPAWNWDQLVTYPQPGLFDQVRRVRYIHETDTLYLGGTTAEHKNQHWKPMGPVVARFDHWKKSGGKTEPRWVVTLPYVAGSSGHESCEPMGFDVAGDFLFLPYTGRAKTAKVRCGHVEVIKAETGQAVGHFEPSAEVGDDVGLQDIVESLRAWKRRDGEYIVFIEDDAKAKIVMYRWKP